MTTRTATNCLSLIRESRGLTQDEVAAMVGTTGVSISRYEREDQRLSIPVMRRLAQALDCTIADIVGEGAYRRGDVTAQPDIQVEPVSSLEAQLTGTLRLLAEQIHSREFSAALSFTQALAGLLQGAQTLGAKSLPSTTSASIDGVR